MRAESLTPTTPTPPGTPPVVIATAATTPTAFTTTAKTEAGPGTEGAEEAVAALDHRQDTPTNAPASPSSTGDAAETGTEIDAPPSPAATPVVVGGVRQLNPSNHPAPMSASVQLPAVPPTNRNPGTVFNGYLAPLPSLASPLIFLWTLLIFELNSM